MLVLRKPRADQPQDFAAPAQELSDGLLAFICPGFGGFANIVTGDSGTNNAATLSVNVGGKSVHTVNGGTQGRYYPVKSIQTVNPWSLVVWLTVGDANAATQAGIVQVASTTASSGGPQIIIARSGQTLRVYDPINSYLDETNALQIGTTHCIVVTYDGAVKRVYRNGAQRASVTSANIGANTATHLWVGNGFPNSGLNDIYLCAYLSRALPADYAAALSLNPLLAFEPEQILIPTAAASSGASGTLATTNANDTSSAAGTTTVRGTLARTNANDTAAASGSTTVVGSLARTNANDTAAASGAVGSSGVSGSLAATNANDTSAATGTTTIVGTLAKTNNNDTSTASGSPVVSGALARTNANDTVVASGAAGAITGTVAYTNNDDTVEARGVGAPSTGAGGLIRSTYHKPSPRLWWLRKPKHLDESEAEDALEVAADAIVSKVAEQVANKATPSEAKKAVKKAIAPALGVMPGFDWNAFYQEAMKAGQLAADERRAMTQAAIKTQIVLEMQALQQRRFDDDEDDVAILAMLL